MSGTVKLNWAVPSSELEKFRRFVEYHHGQINGYMAREVEKAMMEYAEFDEYSEVEDLVNRLVSAAGRTLADLEEKKKKKKNA